MVAIPRRIFGGVLFEFAVGEIKIAQHTVAFGIVREVALTLSQKSFGLTLLALRYQQPDVGGARGWVLRIDLDGMFELLFRFRHAVARLVEKSQRQLRVPIFCTKLSRFLEIGLGLI